MDAEVRHGHRLETVGTEVKSGRAVGLAASAFAASLLLTGGVSGQAYAQTELTARVDELFAASDTDDAPGAGAGAVEEGRIVCARASGGPTLADGAPVPPSPVLKLGSISKQFVAMCIAILAEQGKLSFDDDIRAHLPEMRDYGETLTIRHLLHHTSGTR